MHIMKDVQHVLWQLNMSPNYTTDCILGCCRGSHRARQGFVFCWKGTLLGKKFQVGQETRLQSWTSWKAVFPQLVVPNAKPFASVGSCHLCTEVLWGFERLPEAQSGWRHAVRMPLLGGFQMHANLEGELKLWPIYWFLFCSVASVFLLSSISCIYLQKLI